MTHPAHRRSGLSPALLTLAALCALIPQHPSPAQQPAPAPHPPAGRQVFAASDAYLAGAHALEHNDLATAEIQFARAVQLDPGNHDYIIALSIAREHRLTDLVQRAADARLHGKPRVADALLAEARAIDPQSGVITQHALPGAATRATLLDIEPDLTSSDTPDAEGASIGRPTALPAEIHLRPNLATQSFHLRGDLQEIIQQVTKAYGIRVSFDASTGHQSLRFDLDNTSYEDATRVLFAMAHVFATPLDTTSILIAKDTAENRQRLERQVQETLFIPGQTVEQMNDLANVIRNIFDVKQLTPQATHGTIVLRTRAEDIPAINLALADLLDGGAEVLLQLSIYSVDLSNTRDIGFQAPQFGAYNVSAAAASLVSANQSLVTQAISEGLISSTDSIVAQAFKLIASGLVSSTLLSNTIAIFGGSINTTTGDVSNQFTTTGITSSSAFTFNLALNSSDTRALEDVQERVGDRQTANFRAGSRYPITTSTYSTPSTASLAGVSVNGSSAASLLAQYLGTTSTTTIPQISYEDLGLTLKATPTVQKSGFVSMDLDLKLEALGGTSLNNIPILDSRTLKSNVTVRDGETAVLLSTISKSETAAVNGLPGLTELPGFAVPTEQNATRSSSELILLITPHVIRHRANTQAGPRIAVSVPPSGRVD
jgi:general secretion pathway protein D